MRPRPKGISASTEAHEAANCAPQADPAVAVPRHDVDSEEAHPRRLARERPERRQVHGADHDPGRRSDHDRGGVVRLPEDQGDERGDADERQVDDPEIQAERQPARHQPGVAGALRALRAAQDAAHDPLDRVIDVPRDPAELAADVLDQSDSLGGDRGAHLRRLGDPLDQPLHLVAVQDLVPDAVDHPAVERFDDRVLNRRSVERLGDGLLETRDPGAGGPARARPPCSAWRRRSRPPSPPRSWCRSRWRPRGHARCALRIRACVRRGCLGAADLPWQHDRARSRTEPRAWGQWWTRLER